MTFLYTPFFQSNSKLMTSSEKKHTADTLTEKSGWVRVGLLPFILRPLTFGQIYEMGEYVHGIDAEGLNLNDRVYPIAEMLTRYGNAKPMQEIFIIGAFRRRWTRWMFGRYVRKRLTLNHFKKLMEIVVNAYTANFFLTSIIFLRQTKPMTEPSQTTARGQQSEE